MEIIQISTEQTSRKRVRLCFLFKDPTKLLKTWKTSHRFEVWIRKNLESIANFSCV